MTDGRIPGMWTNQPRFIEMDTHTWCVFTKAIAWSNEAGTDGHIPQRYLPLLHPDGYCQPAYSKLIDMGLWQSTSDGYQLRKWSEKPSVGGLGQSTAEQVESNKDKNRERQAKFRAAKQGDPKGPGGKGVTRDVTRDVGQGPGQGQDDDQEEVLEEVVDQETGEVLTAPSSAAEGGEQNAEASSSIGDYNPVREFMRKYSA